MWRYWTTMGAAVVLWLAGFFGVLAANGWLTVAATIVAVGCCITAAFRFSPDRIIEAVALAVGLAMWTSLFIDVWAPHYGWGPYWHAHGVLDGVHLH